jgi:hypothetical protein
VSEQLTSNGLRSVLVFACREGGCPAAALTVLATQNDPFRVDSEWSWVEQTVRLKASKAYEA